MAFTIVAVEEHATDIALTRAAPRGGPRRVRSMIAKTIEVRDHGTFMPALAIRLEPTCEADRYLLARAGYGMETIDEERTR